MKSKFITTVLSTLGLVALSFPSLAQVTGSTTVNSPDDYPPALPRRRDPSPPQMTFKSVTELPLPGPLRGEIPRLEDGRLALEVEGGTIFVTLEPDLSVTLDSEVNLPHQTRDGEASAWTFSPDLRRRYRTLPEGRVLAERRRRGKWRGAWSLRVAGATLAPPLLVDRRLFFGAVDNQVYAVRSDNGHRLWAADVGERISHPLTLWEGEALSTSSPLQTSPKISLVLLVPDGGASLIALDAHDGRRVATLDLPPEQGRLIAPALVAPDGRVLVATQKYADSEASLRVFRLGLPQPVPVDEDPVTYNEGAGSE